MTESATPTNNTGTNATPATGKKETGVPALLAGWHDRGYLPHLKAKGGTYFVTFRLADTLPAHVLERYRVEREEIVKRAEAMGRELTPDEEKRLAELPRSRLSRIWTRDLGSVG